LRAALYARVSTEDQAKEGFSIPAQVKRLNSYCKARGWEVASEYVDSGFSGRDTKRPAYLEMMEEKDKWDVLVVLKMDRIHRNSKNFTVMMDDLKEWGKEFNSMQESFDTTTAIGRFVMDIIQRIAQLESEQIGERVKIGMSQKAIKGKGYMGFGMPFGFDYVEKKLIRLENEIRIVEEMFQMYLRGRSLQEIADRLNSQGTATKNGKQWSKGTIARILSNPLYCGYMRWDGRPVKAAHEPVVSVTVFEQVQESMLERRRNARSESEHHKIALPNAGEAYG